MLEDGKKCMNMMMMTCMERMVCEMNNMKMMIDKGIRNEYGHGPSNV